MEIGGGELATLHRIVGEELSEAMTFEMRLELKEDVSHKCLY